ncbi:MAG: ribonuclease HI [Deltaproteobacteria bacterium]|jgi:ribonuclease HI|nr:ribonuclease HI [Deltaproteobacteria bacterium]
MAGKPKKYYAVARGGKAGVYDAWFGPTGAEAQVRGFAGAVYRGFFTRDEAERWLQEQAPDSSFSVEDVPAMTGERGDFPSETVHIYTDGSCRKNPGPGGYCAIIDAGDRRTELSGGYRLTTNNRMELMACIAGLKSLEEPSDVIVHSDSRYVVDGMTKGWAEKWRSRNWMRTKTQAAENADLWSCLLSLCDRHRVAFVWVRGHAGHRENERCDQLATKAADGADLVEDLPFIEGRTKLSHPLPG